MYTSLQKGIEKTKQLKKTEQNVKVYTILNAVFRLLVIEYILLPFPDHSLNANPRDGSHGGVALFLGMLHANETGLRSRRVVLWLACAFIFI